jgi:hypothetical protein
VSNERRHDLPTSKELTADVSLFATSEDRFDSLGTYTAFTMVARFAAVPLHIS